MIYTILDCYTDEPAGLGVPPFLGTYPRYLAGALDNYYYITIDDLRLWKRFSGQIHATRISQKTDIRIYNLTKNCENVPRILQKTDVLIVVLGVHTPGKYLSAIPGTLRELVPLIEDLKCKKILTGPAVYGTQAMGGRFAEKKGLETFDEVDENYLAINDYNKINAVRGAHVIKQIPDLRIVEIETSRGCSVGKCSFCVEPLKHNLEFRAASDILSEIKEFYRLGVRHFRLGKQSCFYCYPDAEKLLKAIRKNCPRIDVLHIDNVNPVNVNESITKAIVEYCTPGNVAAFGVESFDREVIKRNRLNCTPETVIKAAEIINAYGAKRGENGMPKFLPGINLLLGLIGESRNTFDENLHWLKVILEKNLLIRRINIRQVAIFPGTQLAEVGKKYLRKNRKYYFTFKKKVREQIDFEMLRKVVPKNIVLKDVRTEIWDGNNTFARQIGAYPLIVGIKQRLPLKEFYNVRITNHMLRSVTGEVV